MTPANAPGKDNDIPVVLATPNNEFGGAVTPMAYLTPTQTSLQNGRSCRVMVPEESTRRYREISECEIQSLKAQGYTDGLIQSLLKNQETFPLRIWVVDNSGSMAAQDGHRIVETTNRQQSAKLVKCTRWTELQETVDYHAQMAALIQAPTVFRLLNDPGRMVGPQQFSVGDRGETFLQEDVQVARQTMKQATPSGCTPLAEHVHEIRENILEMLPQLQQSGQKVAIVLATDGLPTNFHGNSGKAELSEFENALRSLEGLPVWIVIRLCTDEESVVEYYNSLDNQLELSLELLDDFVGEATEVHQQNPWLTYSLCLHRMREMGFHHRLFDLLDERPLTLDEVKDFLHLLLGDLDGVPDPQVDWNGFLYRVSNFIQLEKKQWNPVSKKMTDWVDVKKLKKIYRESPPCCMM